MDEERLEALAEELIELLRPYFEEEQALRAQIAACETEADMLARRRFALMEEARAIVEARLASRLSGGDRP